MMGHTTSLPMSTDPEIFNKGRFLIDLSQQPGSMPPATIDRICARLTQESGDTVRFDWHFIGGHPMLLYLGEYEKAKATFLAACPWIRAEVDAYALEWVTLNDWHPLGPSNIGLPGGYPIADAGMITVGQALHRVDNA
jgi:hypothetical protein